MSPGFSTARTLIDALGDNPLAHVDGRYSPSAVGCVYSFIEHNISSFEHKKIRLSSTLWYIRFVYRAQMGRSMESQLKIIPNLFLDRQEQLRHRDIMNLMEYPFFAISKQPVFETRVYDDGKVRIEVKPGHRGLATIWDKDILIYVASQINRMLNEGVTVSQKVRFHAHDFFISCGRSAGGRAYEDLVSAFDRLQSTSIRTNIATKNGQTERTFFSWIKSGRMTERMINGKPVLGMCEVELEDWVWRQIVEDRTILSIDSAYFQLTSGVARRVYELARKHCGRQSHWTISLPKLAEKIGYSDDDKRNFKRFLGQIVEANDLPEYEVHIALIGDAEGKRLADFKSVRGIKGLKAVFTRRSNVLERRASQDVLDRRTGDSPERFEEHAPCRDLEILPPVEPTEMATAADFADLLQRFTGGKMMPS
jgi:plasmid replication initiation protein